MLDQLGEEYQQVIDIATHYRIPLEAAESRLLGMTHADFIEGVLEQWRFPEHLVAPIGMHHLSVSNIRSANKEIVAMARLIALSNRLAHAMILGSSGNEVLYPFEEHLAALKLKAADFDRLITTIPSQVDDLKLAMLRETRRTEIPESLKIAREMWPTGVAAVYHSMNTTSDCYELYLQRLKVVAEAGEAPGLAIVRFSRAADRERIGQYIDGIDQQLGRRIPCLMISPKGNIHLEASLMANRKVASIAIPTPIRRFVEAVDGLIASDKRETKSAA